MKKIKLCVTVILIGLYLYSCAIPSDLGGGGDKAVPVPGGVTVQIISLESVTVSWNPVSGAASYSVFRSLSGEADSFTRVKVTPETSWTDTGLATGTEYYYRVSAAMNNAGEGKMSATVSARPMKPSVPANVRSEAVSANRIDISWDAALAAVSYKVYRAENADGSYSPLSAMAITELTYIDTSVTGGKGYYYKVAGENNLGEGILSAYTFSATTVPPVPVGVTGTALSETQITVSWNAVSGASTYRLYRAGDSGGPFTILTIITAPDTTYTDASLNPVTEYFYKVSAVNGIGEGGQSETASAVTRIPPPDTVSAAPDSAASIAVSWSQVNTAINYKVYRCSTGENGPYELVATIPGLSYSDTISDTGLRYYYKVSAVNVNGESSLSVHASAGFVFPESPSSLTAVPLSATSLTISWNPSPGASSYNLYHSNTTATGTYNLLATVNDTNYTHTGLTVNTDYFYRVSAVNIIGEGEKSAYITGRITAPATPANVRVEPVSHTSLRISWDPVPGALMYSVYRNTGSTVSASNMITSITGTYYIDTGLNPFSQYFYKVSATNDIGTGSLTATAVSAYTQPIPLEEGVWYSSTTSSGSYDYYSFPVTGGNYFIQWGNVGHTTEATYFSANPSYSYGRVSAYWNSINSRTGLSTSYFVDEYNGLANPRLVQAPNSGYIIIGMSRVGSNSSFGYDIRFYKE
jgi:fibronectin type 3 domain-containing protein